MTERTFAIDRWSNPEGVEPSGRGQELYVRGGPHTMSDLEDHSKIIGDHGGNVIRFLDGDHTLQGQFWGRLMQHGGPFRPWPNGTEDHRNVITCNPEATLYARRAEGARYAFPAVDLAAIWFWDVVNVNIGYSDFAGVRLAYSGGAPGRPSRVWGVQSRDVHHSNIQVQGWWSDPWKPSAHVDIAGGVIRGGDVVRDAPEFGEGVYLGSGYRPQDGRAGWVDRSHHIRVRCMDIQGVTSDPIEVKTGVDHFTIEDNLIGNIVLPDGGTDTSVPVGYLTACYANDRPPERDRPVNGVIRRNRLYGLSTGSDWTRAPIVIGRGGIRCYSNLGWGFTHGTFIETRTGAGGMGAGTVEVVNNGAPPDRRCFRDMENYDRVVAEFNTPDDGGETMTGPFAGDADAGFGPGSGWAPGEPTAPVEPLTDVTGARLVEPRPTGPFNP